MAERENSRLLASAEALIVTGMLLFIAPLVLNPMVGLTYLAHMLLTFAGIALCLIAAFLVRARVDDFVKYLAVGKEQEVALWRNRPVRGGVQIAIFIFLGAVIWFPEWMRPDQVAAIVIAALILGEVVDRGVKVVRASP